MRAQNAAVIALLGTFAPAGVLAQSPETGADPQLRTLVRPLTPADQVARDAERAAVELQQQQRREDRVVRGLDRPAARAPQADADLAPRTETRSLDDASRR